MASTGTGRTLVAERRSAPVIAGESSGPESMASMKSRGVPSSPNAHAASAATVGGPRRAMASGATAPSSRSSPSANAAVAATAVSRSERSAVSRSRWAVARS